MTLHERMCAAGRRLWERHLVGAAEGNLSVRMPNGHLLATPTGIGKGDMRPEDLAELRLDGDPVTVIRPSSEIRLHLRCYRERPDCQAVVHAHPITATGLSLAGRTIPDDVLLEAAYVLGPVALVPFAMPGTEDLPDALMPYLADHKTFLLSHHGALTLGTSLEDAVQRMETLERCAQMLLAGEAAGRVHRLPEPVATFVRSSVLSGRL